MRLLHTLAVALVAAPSWAAEWAPRVVLADQAGELKETLCKTMKCVTKEKAHDILVSAKREGPVLVMTVFSTNGTTRGLIRVPVGAAGVDARDRAAASAQVVAAIEAPEPGTGHLITEPPPLPAPTKTAKRVKKGRARTLTLARSSDPV